MWTTWLMISLDMIVLVHSCSCWCACRAAVLLGNGCPHHVSQHHLHIAKCAESLMVIGFGWCCIHTLLLSCTLACLTGSSVCKKCMFVPSSVCEHILTCSYVHPSTITSLHDRLFARTSLCMHHLFIHWRTCLSACATFIHPIYCHAIFVCVTVSTVTHEETTSIP